MVIVLAIALVIGWTEERCQAQAYQCRAEYAAKLGSVPADQKATEQQAIAAACEPNGYFCRLFSAANLPTMLLVVIGAAGIWAALRSLRVIERQTIAIEQQTKLQSVQWVALKNWRGEFRQPYMFSVTVDVVNETSFPLTLEGTDFRVGTVISAGTENVTLIPRGTHSVGFVHQMSLEEATAYHTNRTAFGVRGAIRFSGIGGKRVQPFGGLIAASAHDGMTFESRSEYEQSAKEHYGDKKPAT